MNQIRSPSLPSTDMSRLCAWHVSTNITLTAIDRGIMLTVSYQVSLDCT